MITIELTEREAGALARTLDFTRDVFDTMGIRGSLDDLGTPPGESALEITHAKVIAAIERQEVAA